MRNLFPKSESFVSVSNFYSTINSTQLSRFFVIFFHLLRQKSIFTFFFSFLLTIFRINHFRAIKFEMHWHTFRRIDTRPRCPDIFASFWPMDMEFLADNPPAGRNVLGAAKECSGLEPRNFSFEKNNKNKEKSYFLLYFRKNVQNSERKIFDSLVQDESDVGGERIDQTRSPGSIFLLLGERIVFQCFFTFGDSQERQHFQNRSGVCEIRSCRYLVVRSIGKKIAS